jgi:hypothetical protein
MEDWDHSTTHQQGTSALAGGARNTGWDDRGGDRWQEEPRGTPKADPGSGRQGGGGDQHRFQGMHVE